MEKRPFNRANLNCSGGRSSYTPIAIIGLGCRFPGGANDPQRFWQNLVNGVDAVREVPEQRWNRLRYYHAQKNRPGKSCSRWGGFIDDIDLFDPQFFGISPREAQRMDPQQRLLLEVAWQAIEDGGQVLERLSGSKTAVFVGISSWDYSSQGNSFDDRAIIDTYTNTGGSLSIAANRISYCFDLRGPSAAVDTACSSALVALHMACQSLWNEGCSFALAGGVNALLLPDLYVAFSQLGMLSPDGRCKAFDARANGFVRGEGAGMVLLKPLPHALADNDRIYAVIRGTALNQDGRTPGMTVPRQEAQEALLRQACQNAGIAPQRIQYLEAHGTGTPVGDPIEARALGNVLGAGRPMDRPCLLGSVKTNIGHLEAGSGIASLIKVALALHHRCIPGNLHFLYPNPDIDFDRLGLRVPVKCEPWPAGTEPRLAGINGFGYGGTNAHVLVEEAPLCEQTPPVAEPDERAELVVLSARSPNALQAAAQSMHDYVAAAAAEVTLPDIAGHTALRRTHHDHRLVVVASSKTQLANQLAAFAQDNGQPATWMDRVTTGGTPRVAFACSGQGPQWWGMGRELLAQEPLFRNVIERCDAVTREVGTWSLVDELRADEAHSRMALTSISQPALFALQVGLAELWRSWGVTPLAVLGHSVGEVAAAHLAGVFPLEEAMRVVYQRGRCMELARSHGRMLAASLSLDEACELVADYGQRVTIAAVNSPSSVTLSGDADCVEELARLLEERQIFCRRLKVEYAFHSPQMDPIRQELLRSLEGIKPQLTTQPLFSTVTGELVEGPELNGEYWWHNVRQMVRFAAAVQHVRDLGCDVIVELGPHPVLAASIEEIYQQVGKPVRVLPSLRRKEPERPTLLGSLGRLHTGGYPVKWSGVVRAPLRHVSLPYYPWQRERFWFESRESRRTRLQSPAHPLLGSASGGSQPAWQNRLDLRLFPYLADHRVQQAIVFPAAGYVEMALAAARETFGSEACRIEDFRLVSPCVLTAESAHWLESRYCPQEGAFQISGQPLPGEESWTVHATAVLRSAASTAPTAVLASEPIQERCPQPFSRESCQVFFQKLGLNYGKSFRGIAYGWRRPGESLSFVELPEEIGNQAADYVFHPALLDACFQGMIAADPDFDDVVSGLYLPVNIERIYLHRRPEGSVWCHARLLEKTRTRMRVDLDIYDENAALVLELRGFSSQRVTGAGDPEQKDLFYGYVWQPQPLPDKSSPGENQRPAAATHAGWWLMFADQSGVAGRLATSLQSRGDRVIRVTHGTGFAHRETDHYQMDPAARQGMFAVVQAALSGEREACRGIIHLWNLDAPDSSDLSTSELEAAQDAGLLSVLHLVQAWAAQDAAAESPLYLVTRGAQSVGPTPQLTAVAQSPVIGFGRVIVSEYPKLRCKLVDLGTVTDVREEDQLAQELAAADEEDEVALRGGERYVHRYVSSADCPRIVQRRGHSLPYRLTLDQCGTLEGLKLSTLRRRTPAAGEVEIEVVAAALNFSDVMKVLGLYPGMPDGPVTLGAECSGIVTRVGAGVQGFSAGDEVVAVAPGAFASHVTTRAELVVAKPAQLSFEEAASIPIVFLTADYALNHLARLEAGERVLIHSAAGGVGLAAIQLARRAGAEVFATAGTPEKRQLLRELGIALVMDSRSLSFADEILAANGGAGVDVVLNSLPGDAIREGLRLLSEQGRFLEIGKRDIYQNTRVGLQPFRNNLSFFAIDLDQLIRSRPGLLGRLLQQLLQEFSAGRLAPVPLQVFPVDRIVDGFRLMQQGKHVGKIVVALGEGPAQVAPGQWEPLAFRDDATYLIAGGLGGFGLAVAQWLVQRGARHLALVGRRGAKSVEARRAVESLQSAGARVAVFQADVSREEDVAAVLESIHISLPPLRGVFHAAMVLEDGLLLNLDHDWMRRVMAPKMYGAWNLHRQTQHSELDYFVLFSSLSSVFGHAGQGNYAAANAFLDALAYHRRASRLPCLAVNWGFLGDVGYLAQRTQLGERLERQGVQSFSIHEALASLERALQEQAVQISVMRIDWTRWRGLGVTDRISPRFAHLVPQRAGGEARSGNGLPAPEALREASPAERPPLVERLLRDKVSKLLGVAADKIDRHTPLLDLGLDSLMAVELRNWIEGQLQINVPVVQLMRSPSLSRLTALLCQALEDLQDAGHAQAAEPDNSLLNASPEQILAGLDQLSGEQVDDLLATLLQEQQTYKND